MIDDFEKKVRQIQSPALRRRLRKAAHVSRNRTFGTSASPVSQKSLFGAFGKGFVEGTKRISPVPQLSIMAEMMRPKPAGAGSDKPTKSDVEKQKKYLASLKK